MKLTYPPGATPLDANEASGLIPTTVATLAELNAHEQANILEARQWLMTARFKTVLDEAFARSLHRRMFRNVWKWAGKYRTSDKNIGVHWARISEEVRKLFDDATYWLENKTYGWDEFGARLHHRLVSIHPFSNGNGRHARLLTDVCLSKIGHPSFSWGARDIGQEGDVRSRYIQALKAADNRNLQPLLVFVRS